jgi:hypoxanthine phosphoribosyltransferase
MVQKLYLAIVRGPLPYEGGSIKDPIARSKRNPQAMHVHPRLGKPSHTVWKQLADFGHLALVSAQIITGRTHQIRIHFSHRGMPLAIDPIYGASEPLMLSGFKMAYRAKFEKDEPPLIDRLTLHAYQLTIPVGPEGSEEPRTFTATPDKKFAAAIKLLAKHTAKVAAGFKDPQDLDRILKGEPLEYPLQKKPADSEEGKKDYDRILISAEQIEQTVKSIADRLNETYVTTEPVTAVVLLEGARRFAEDLLRQLVFTVEVQYIKASSYYGSTHQTEFVCMEGAETLTEKVRGRDVLVIDDIYDTGKTLATVLRWLDTCRPRSVKTCVLLEKEITHEQPVTIDFLGITVEDTFVVGYGLDYEGRLRELPFVAALNENANN